MFRPAPLLMSGLAGLLLLAGCGRAEKSVAAAPEDAAVIDALADPIMTDPDLTSQDQSHAAMPTQPTLTWSTEGKGNTVSPAGVFSPGTTTGAFSVFAGYDGLTGLGRVAVRDFTLTATPSTVTVSRGSHASSNATSL